MIRNLVHIQRPGYINKTMRGIIRNAAILRTTADGVARDLMGQLRWQSDRAAEAVRRGNVRLTVRYVLDDGEENSASARIFKDREGR